MKKCSAAVLDFFMLIKTGCTAQYSVTNSYICRSGRVVSAHNGPHGKRN